MFGLGFLLVHAVAPRSCLHRKVPACICVLRSSMSPPPRQWRKKSRKNRPTVPIPAFLPLTPASPSTTLIRLHPIAIGGLMPETQGQEPNEVLVDIFETEQESEAMVVQSLLESAGIEVLQTSYAAPQDVMPGVGGVALRVREDQAEEARAILAQYQNKGLTEAEANG